MGSCRLRQAVPTVRHTSARSLVPSGACRHLLTRRWQCSAPQAGKSGACAILQAPIASSASVSALHELTLWNDVHIFGIRSASSNQSAHPSTSAFLVRHAFSSNGFLTQARGQFEQNVTDAVILEYGLMFCMLASAALCFDSLSSNPRWLPLLARPNLTLKGTMCTHKGPGPTSNSSPSGTQRCRFDKHGISL